jgi:hypothetical protein
MLPRFLVSQSAVPQFLVEDTAVQGPGEGPIFDTQAFSGQPFLLTLGITHAVEQESLELDLLASDDGVNWQPRPVVSFTPKFYCGTYHAPFGSLGHRYLKPVWRASRWARGSDKPFFRFYLHAEAMQGRAMAGVA